MIEIPCPTCKKPKLCKPPRDKWGLEARRKTECRSCSKKGSKNPAKTPETRKKMSDAKRGKPGRKLSDEEKLVISVRMKGKPKSAEHRRKISEANKRRTKTITENILAGDLLYSDAPSYFTRFKSWANFVKDIYEGSCAKCGAKEDLHAHHIVPKRVDQTLANDLNNGMCLCRECHYEIHRLLENNPDEYAQLIKRLRLVFPFST